MLITRKHRGTKETLIFSGDLDEKGKRQIESLLNILLSARTFGNLTLDFSNVKSVKKDYLNHIQKSYASFTEVGKLRVK